MIMDGLDTLMGWNFENTKIKHFFMLFEIEFYKSHNRKEITQ